MESYSAREASDIIFDIRDAEVLRKSSLLAKVKHELTFARVPVARVDLEPFKGHSYPDLLISILIKMLSAFKEWLEVYGATKATKHSVWTRMFSPPA